MFLLYLTFITCLWNIFCSITKIGVKLKYENVVRDRETLLAEKKVRVIAGVKYNVSDPPFWVETDPVSVYNSVLFKNETLTPYQIYCHMDCFGVDSVHLVDKKDSILSGIRYTVVIMGLFLFLNETCVSLFVLMIQLLNHHKLSCIYLKVVKNIRNQRLKRYFQSCFKFSMPCDTELYDLDKMTLVMLEHCNPLYAIEMPYHRISSSFEKYFLNINHEEGEHSLKIPINFNNKRMEMHLNYELKNYACYNLFVFNLMVGKYFVDQSILFENEKCIHDILNESCKNIFTAMVYGSSIKSFDKIRDGSTHKKEFFKCNDFKVCCLTEKVFVKGYIDINSALTSIFTNDKKKITISFQSVKNQIEYAEKFFCNPIWASDADNMRKLLLGLKYLIVNKSARNKSGMPNSAWKRFCSDCCWISDTKYKGLDHKDPSKALLEFSKEKDVQLTDPALKYYNKAEFISRQKVKDRNIMKEYFAKETENRRKFSEELNSLSEKKVEKILTESKNKNLYLKICDSVRSNTKIELENRVIVDLRSVDIEHTKETYKEKLISKISDLEKEMNDFNANLRDKSISNKDKQNIRDKMYKTKTMKDICNRGIVDVNKGEFNELRHFRFPKEEKASVSFFIRPKNKDSDILILFNSYDLLRDLESKEEKNEIIRKPERKKKVEETNTEMAMFLKDYGGVANARKKVGEEIKIRTGIDCDEMLEEKIRLRLLECSKKFNKNKYNRSKSKIIDRYKMNILNKIEIDDMLDLKDGKKHLQIPLTFRPIKRLLLSNMFATLKMKLFQSTRIMNDENEIFYHLRSLFK